MTNVILENIVNIFTTLLIMLIGVLGTWLTAQIGKSQRLGNIKTAVESVVNMAQLTAKELQQTVVEDLKHANADNKLTKEEIDRLGVLLLNKTREKLSVPTYDLLNAAGVDIEAIIRGAGEAWIQEIKAANYIIPSPEAMDGVPQ